MANAISESIMTLSGMEYYEGKNKDRLDANLAKKAEKEHKHTISDITDFPKSMPASDVSEWAKAEEKPEYTKAEVGLSNVDNTADADKDVKHAVSADSAENASKVNNHTVESDVPANAKFTDTVYTHPTTAGNKHIPSGGSSGKILVWSASGTAKWDDAPKSGNNNALQDTEPTDQSVMDEWYKEY